MPNTSMEDQAEAQAMYMGLLVKKAKDKAKAMIDLAFDPQERLLVEVSLEIDEMRVLLEKINLKAVPPFVSLEEALGRKPTLATTVSVDISGDEDLSQKFLKKLTKYLKAIGASEDDAKKITNHLQNIPKGSIIALQQEYHFHLALACRVYQKVAEDKLTGKEAAIKTAHEETLLEVNQLIMTAYAKALKSATSEDGFYIDIAKLNKELDKARTDIMKQSHTILMEKIIENTGVILKEKELKKPSNNISIKHIAEKITSTPNDVIHTDTKTKLATMIAGSENTSHERVVGTKFGDRQIITHFINEEGEIIAGENQRLQIRTPSPVVKEGLEEEEYISDVATKLSYIRKQYDLKNRVSGDNVLIPKAFIYNSYTAFNSRLSDINGNLQTQSARHILYGAHQYNAAQLNQDVPVYCFVQNISVNGWGDTLGYNTKNALKIESTLMTEMALLHTLYETATDPEKLRISAIFKRYTTFLLDETVNKEFFSQSVQGKRAIEEIDTLKKDWIKPAPIALAPAVDKAKLGLKHLMAHNLHCTHQYSKLFQALSVYSERVSIGGCKSGNERAQAINGRVAIFDSVLNNAAPNPDELEIQQLLYKLAEGKDVLTVAKDLKSAVDKLYNKRGLQTAASLISLLDQGASAKVEAGSDVLTTSTNQGEEPESVMTNLHQSKAGKMQAHKDLTKVMVGSWKGYSDSWLNRMSGPIGPIGAFFKLITIGLPLYYYFDNKKRLAVSEKQREAQDVYKALPQIKIDDSPLTKQIGVYRGGAKENKSFVTERLSPDVVKVLYQGVKEYQNQHLFKIIEYETKHSKVASNSNDLHYFRKALVAFIETKEKIDKTTFSGDPVKRKSEPVTAAIKMKEFLGPEGADLYRLALEEEMNSKEYRDAVFKESTTHYEGEKWTKRPVIIVAGPSGCGKSFAAESAVRRAAEEFLPKVAGSSEGNDVLAVDGGVGRDVSQMRKLLVQAANNKGYSGIKDLHKQSKVLGAVKDIIQEVGFATPSLGVVIPETFSKWINPVDNVHQLMSTIEKLPGTKQIFARVKGEDRDKFPDVVGFMGSRRAWKTDGFALGPEAPAFDLNKNKVFESKEYGASGFKPGKWGSKQAEKWYKDNSKEDCSMIIVNDLQLLKKNPDNDKEWIPAKGNDEGAALFSKRIYDAWSKLDKDKRPSLDVYNKANPKSTIYTSSLNITIKEIKEKLPRVQEFNKLVSKNADQFKWIAEMDPAVHVYNLAVQEKFKTDSPPMITKYKELSQQCDRIVNQLKNNQKILEESITKIPLDIPLKRKDAVDKLSLELQGELAKVKSNLALYESAQKNLSGEHGLIKAFEEAKEGKKNFLYKTDQMACTVCARSDMPDLDSVSISEPLSSITTGKSQSVRNFLLEEIPDGQVAVYDVQHTTQISATETIQARGRFTEECLESTQSERQVKASSTRLEIVQFPTQDTDSPKKLHGLIEARIKFSMAMAIQALASMDGPPTKEKPLRLRGDNYEEMRYIWTALIVLGENNKKMKFDMDAIKVDSASFNPESEKGTFSKFNSKSLYHQVFKNLDYQNPIKQKIKDVQELANSKSGQEEVMTKVETLVKNVTLMFKKEVNGIRDKGSARVADKVAAVADSENEDGDRPASIH